MTHMNSKIPALLTGFAIGGAAGLLLAPQSGRRTRQLIRRKGEDAAYYVSNGTFSTSRSKIQAIAEEAARLVRSGTRRFAR